MLMKKEKKDQRIGYANSEIKGRYVISALKHPFEGEFLKIAV